MAQVLNTIQARPPSPPRSSSRTVSALQTLSLKDPGVSVRTPEDSPSPSAPESADKSSSRNRKKVEFSAWSNIHKAPMFVSSSSTPSLKTLPPSKECKSTKSILKPSSQPSSSPMVEGRPAHLFESTAVMLDSIVQQLAGNVRASSLDAYASLCGAMKAYESMPEPQDLVNKLGLITQFLERDLSVEPSEDQPFDTNLTTHALKLLTILVWNPKTSDFLPEDFRIFVVERSIHVLEEHRLPKPIIMSYVQLLAIQHFRPKIMTADRATRIFAALDTITEHVKGNAIVCQRLLVYQRFLDQAKAVMTSNMRIWMEHMISGMLSNVPDTRSKAIALGIQAGMVLGNNTAAANALRDVLERQLENGESVISNLCKRLTKMISSPSDGPVVPQIWASIILLLRSLKPSFESWEHFKAWIHVEQSCFNCSNASVKYQANLAWNRFIFAIQPSQNTGLPMIKLLSAPITLQLERYRPEKSGKQSIISAISCYCNLLYYAFRPSSSPQQLDLFWEQYVMPVLSGPLGSNPVCCELLATMLWNEKPEVWSENRANELPPLQPSQIPTLECRWVRARSAKILKSFLVLFKHASWIEGFPDHSQAGRAWKSFCTAIGQACRKEVKPSTETMQLVAHIFTFFQHIWNGAPNSLNARTEADTDAFLDRFRFLATSFIQAVGPIPFTEKLLSKPVDGGFQPTATPHQTSKVDSTVKLPILHLLELIQSFPDKIALSAAYLDLVRGVLRAMVDVRSSRQSTIQLYSQCAESVGGRQALPGDLQQQTSLYIWQAIASSTTALLKPGRPEKGKHDKTESDLASQDLIKLLKIGSVFEDERYEDWNTLLEATVSIVRRDHGEHHLISHVLDPLAEALGSQPNEASLARATKLLRFAPIRRDSYHQDVKKHHLSVRPQLLGKRKQTSAYDKILTMMNDFLSLCYQHGPFSNDRLVPQFIDACIGVLKTTPTEMLIWVLHNLQRGLSHWLRDTDRKIVTESHAENFKVLARRRLTDAIVREVQRLPNHDSAQLDQLEDLITSGFESSHRSTVNRFTGMWNSSFGAQTELQYPIAVDRALRRYAAVVNLVLPTFLDGQPNELSPEPLDLILSQEEDMVDPIADDLRFSSPMRALSSSLALMSERENRRPQPSQRTPNKATPRAKLRHENSQIQFVAIESSRLLGSEAESQALTERQKEVKRQKAETATMLRDFLSSPLPAKVSQKAASRRQLPSDNVSASDTAVIIRPSTPILPKQMDEGDDAITSSPTPRSQTQIANLAKLDLPSSPPVSLQEAQREGVYIDPPSSPPAPTTTEPNGLITTDLSPVHLSAEDEMGFPPAIHDARIAQPVTPTNASSAPSRLHWTPASTLGETPEASTQEIRSSLPTSIDVGFGQRVTTLELTAPPLELKEPVDADISQLSNSFAPDKRPSADISGLPRQQERLGGENATIQPISAAKAAPSDVHFPARRSLEAYVSSDGVGRQIASQLESELEMSTSANEIDLPTAAQDLSSPTSQTSSRSKKRKAALVDPSLDLECTFRQPATMTSPRADGVGSRSPAPPQDKEDLFDCIVVDTSSPPRQFEAPSFSQISQMSDSSISKRGRGRPRKSVEVATKGERKRSLPVAEDGDSSVRPDAEQQVPRKRIRTSKSRRASSPLRDGGNALQPPDIHMDGELSPYNLPKGMLLGENQEGILSAAKTRKFTLKMQPLVVIERKASALAHSYEDIAKLKDRSLSHEEVSQAGEECDSSEDCHRSPLNEAIDPANDPPKAPEILETTTHATDDTLRSGESPFAETEGSEGWIIGSLKRILGSLKTASVGEHTHRQIDDVMFEIRKEVVRAADRH